METIVFYHGGCVDGLAAAWCIYTVKSNVNVYPVYDRSKIEADYKDKIVYCVDIVFTLDIMKELQSHAKKLIIIDHHITSKATLDQLPVSDNTIVIFDLTKCAAMLTVHYLACPPPWFFDIINQRDIWEWKSEEAKYISKFIFVQMQSWKSDARFTFKFFDELLDISRNDALRLGKLSYDFDQSEIIKACLKAKEATFTYNETTHSVYITDGNIDYRMRSDVGNKLCEDTKCDFAAICSYDQPTDTWNIALRCISDKVDLISIGKFINSAPGASGGHKKAAGTCIVGKDKLYEYFKLVEN